MSASARYRWPWSGSTLATRLRPPGSSHLYATAIIFGSALLLQWLCAAHPAELPAWLPWDFSPTEFISIAFALWWYARGLALTPWPERPSAWRQLFYFVGILAIYAVLQTRFEYAALHMFLLMRVQHVVMHHLGPMLIALSWPHAVIARGMPETLVAPVRHWLVRGMVNVLQQPLLAGLLFVGLIYLWLIPVVHWHAMLDLRLYGLMNWSMVVDGLLFWCLVLDRRPPPVARLSFAARGALVSLVMFPQILLGALIVFSTHDLYRAYDLCGRLYPSVGALTDQTYGGLVIWIPPAMMSVIGLVIVLDAARRASEQEEAKGSSLVASTRVDARSWTG